LVAGAAAGVVAWLGGEAIRGTLQPVERSAAAGPALNETERLIRAGLTKEATFAFVMMGGSLGLALGFAGGLARRSMGAAMIAAVAGLVLGAVAAFGTSAVLMPIATTERLRMTEDLTYSILILGGVWSALGAAGGLAFGIGLGGPGRIGRAALGGLLGAALGTVLYEVLGAVVFPVAQTGTPLPLTWPARLFARLAVALSAAAGAAMLVQGPAPASRPEAPAPPPAA
jgi:hypothetical protein